MTIQLSLIRRAAALAAFAGVVLASVPAPAADDCKNRGRLDPMYCDEDNDLTADLPKDKSKWKNPSTLIFMHWQVESTNR